MQENIGVEGELALVDGGGPWRAVGMSSEVHAFIDAAHYAGRVLCDPGVGERWRQPSVLARMDVGSVAGHLYLVLRRVNKHLDAPLPSGGGVAPPSKLDRLPTIRVADEADLDADVHVRVRIDGQRIAERGWSSVTTSFGAVVDALTARLADPPEMIVPLGGSSPFAFAPYLASRVVELLVHADDLALSVGLEVLPPAAGTVDVALGFLLESARALHGDVAVLRAFTRRERTPPGIPAVY